MRNYKKIYLFLLFLLVISFSTGCFNKKDLKVSNEEPIGTDNSNNKELADIEELAKKCAFNVTWYTDTDVSTSGTAFLLDSKVHNEKVLVTAFHFLWPDDAEEFKGSELPAYIKGGKLKYCYSDEMTGATLKNCLVIEDADILPNVKKDIAAFTLRNADHLQTLPLATESCKEGETIYLLADLWDTDDIHENCVYECKVLFEEDGVLYYELDKRYGTTGASGAPLVNKYGEVVGIHIGKMGSIRSANPASNIAAMIDKAYASDITYPEELDDSDQTSDIATVNLNQDDLMETIFFNLGVKDINLKEKLNGNTYDGYQYLILDLELSLNDHTENTIGMYYNDFYVEWGSGEEDYCYPLEGGFTDKQLPDEYVISPGEVITGQLIFLVPESCSNVDFCYQDYYTNGTSEETHYGDFYVMNIQINEKN